MAKVELIMPKLGESVTEATILTWEKQVGDTIEMDENVVVIATDKVDTEVPSPVEGKLVEILFQEGDTVAVGSAIALIESDSAVADVKASPAVAEVATSTTVKQPVAQNNGVAAVSSANLDTSSSNRFYSPLVKSIAKEEGIALDELERISGTGKDSRVTKSDMLVYLENRGATPAVIATTTPATQPKIESTVAIPQFKTPPVNRSGNVEIIEMDRMRRLIADHMVMSKHVSPHVTSFVEADVTDLVNWRNRVKKDFQERHGEKITFTPIFMEAVVKAIQDYPMVNVAVDGNQIVRYKDINIGMAAALPSGNLIVPVIKNAENLNMVGLTKNVNDLANRARSNKLRPDEIQGGTFTLTNVGTFGNVMGTPIINQPQAAILAVGAIRKKPAVVETEYGDVIAIRHMMFLSLSYDHRVVDGMLGGSFLRRVADYLEQFDATRSI
ncbi:MAG: Dihydrolipoamide acyltransferase component of branched-chain alpha-keto acid dehydrogenase complex (EC [uncultured Aureispira sp.]|uniref:Dihydrolipoamide acetyltransferase component of pyruvate dehydrogenase complex n=1 Tax=uncultured Aureispira sp. TaxID=1331704 RepID=A0A6S6T5L6_9BACT|nr:MAG: Dihydrolipoamide acyltransferase component of branched-chain alpha-keto acid dehydrogenase complex (EC [uncultured Aureispira sp.]